MDNELIYWMALAHADARKLTTVRKMRLVVKMHELRLPLSTLFMSKNMWSQIGITEQEQDAINEASELLTNYAFQLEGLLHQGYQLIPVNDQHYPKTLKENMKYNSPLLLYVKGDVSLLDSECVAIVGARKAGERALIFTANIARKAVEEGKTVVSGFAAGVDQCATDTALAAGGKSIVIIPQGITTFGTGYNKLYKYIVNRRALVVSYFKPDAGWDKGLAMARNSVIYGMADDIYVAQSDFKGGTYEGVNQGLKTMRKIYIRLADNDETIANNTLIEAGGVPVDINGNIVEYKPKMIIDEILNLLREKSSATLEEITKFIFGTTGSVEKEKVKSSLEQMSDIELSRKKNIVYYLLKSPTLF